MYFRNFLLSSVDYPSLSAIDYLVRAVEIVKKKSPPINLSRDVYSVIAKEFNVSKDAVSKEIRKLINSISDRKLAKAEYYYKKTNSGIIYHFAFNGDKIWKKWTVTIKVKCGKVKFAVCRVKDITKPISKDNLEFATDYIDSEVEAEKIAFELNGGKL